MKDRLELLHDSPFFEVFDPEHLEALARHASMRTFQKGAVILEEDSPADHFYMLVSGEVQLSFRRPGPRRHSSAGDDDQVVIHDIHERGRPVGWSSMVEPYRYRATAIACRRTQLLALDRTFLDRYCAEHPAFGAALMKRILWVLGNRLRATRIRLVAKRYRQEILAIRALLDQSAELLSVTSPLHKLSHYLESRLTLADAFHVLEALRAHGTVHERSLAELCLEILKNVRKEMQVYQDQQRIYQAVAGAPDGADPVEVRRRCCEAFVDLFDRTDYIVRGEEHLPDRPGHIFIMNHLSNHPDNTLPNEFQLTLDTHFVSAMLLFRKYGEPPVRVIRKSRPDEFGHQQYYDRLGYIYVYRGHVDEAEGDPERLAEERRRHFLDGAGQVLRTGTNVVICPEGSSTSTERSPLPFRAGAFRLAAHVRPEPLIVPIAVAGFDRKITKGRLAAIVHPPFRLSDHVPDPVQNETLYRFIAELHERYTGWVRSAAEAIGG